MSHYVSDPSATPVQIKRMAHRRVAAIGLPTVADAPRRRSRTDVLADAVPAAPVPVDDGPTYADFLVDPAAARTVSSNAFAARGLTSATAFIADESQEVS